MTPTPRRPSFRVGFWLLLSLLSVALLVLAPLGPVARPTLPALLFWVAHLCLLFALWSTAAGGPLWGLGAVSWLGLLLVLGGLAARQNPLVWMAPALALLGGVAHRGVRRWNGVLQEAVVRRERVREEVNTRADEIQRLQGLETAASERLRRYQKLRQIANAFHLTLNLEDLLACVVQGTADLVGDADLVLLYLVDPEVLRVELRKVWRRSGAAPVKAKHGDAFDQWVLRQSQPLLVEDVGRDFRFEQARVDSLGRSVAGAGGGAATRLGAVGSLLAVPLMSKHRCLGILRLESAQAGKLGSDELRLVGIIGDLASLGIENSRLYGRMAELAMTDDLTGLGVRRYFLQEAEKFLSEQPRTFAGSESSIHPGSICRVAADAYPAKVRGCVLLIDIDRFKDYNDQFGHSAGDKLLKQIGGILLALRRPGDVVARLGGEEFACLLRGVGEGEALRRAEEIRRRVEMCPVELRRSVTRITVSIGMALFPGDGTGIESLLQAADRRLYQAKAEGRNRVCAQG